MVYRFGSHDLIYFIFLSFLGFFLFFIPLVILHLNYFSTNKRHILHYYPYQNRIDIIKNNDVTSFHFDDIKNVFQYKTFPLAENRVQWFPWDNYNYSVINLENGHKLIITSLLVPNLDLPIDKSKVFIVKTFYPYIKE
jgi:hypothetical protein